ncbi:MAG TPA: LamG-like jellyroll fold domain-containing protein [Phycisphaerae bacterium]|nr:LamG-like jellyroll fold domain-containing protein [Phycisphaerae bacterium]
MVRRTIIACVGVMVLSMAAVALAGEGAKASPWPAETSDPAAWAPAQKAIAELGDGFIVWETRRDEGVWSLWTIKLDGTGLRRLSPREDGRVHIAAHISPDGKRVAYLSLPREKDNSKLTDEQRKLPLHLINIDGTGDKVIVPDARTYGWSRAVVWLNDNEIAHLDAKRDTYRLNLTTGQSTPIYMGQGDNPGWLPNAALTHMTACFSTFCPYDAKTQKINFLPSLGGCQPYFTQDGNWGFWMHGGEVVAKMNLATRVINPIITGHELPDRRGHLYCSMISDNNMLLAFVACDPAKFIQDDEGGYFGCSRSPYKIFVVRLDPKTLDTVSRPVQYTFGELCDRFPDIWQATPELGYGGGKAPYSIEFSAKDLGGQAQWDFGDGATDKGAAGRHTYDKPGMYVVKAVAGDKTLRGLVNVRPAKPPIALGATLEKARELIVTFDEPVQLKDVKVELESKIGIEKVSAGESGRTLHILLAQRPRQNDWLTIDNVTDLAQHPSKMEKTRLAIPVSPWPTNMKDLICLWQTGDKPNTIRDPFTNEVRTATPNLSGLTWLDRNQALVFDGGGATIYGVAAAFSNAVRQTHQFSYEFTMTPRDLDSTRQSVLRYGFWQDKDKLRFEYAGKSFELATVKAKQPYHVVVSYQPGKLLILVNGQEVVNTDQIQDDLNGYKPPEVTMGNDLDGHRWRGTIEGVASYCRALSAEEAKANYQVYRDLMAQRKAPPRLEVEAKMVASSQVLLPKEIAPYKRALTVFEYEVAKVLDGEYKAKRVRVAHWAVLDMLSVRIVQWPIGTQVRLVLEPMTICTQFKEENISDTLELSPDLPTYFATTASRLTSGPQQQWNLIGGFGNGGAAWKTPQEIETLKDIVKTYPLKKDQKWEMRKADANGYINGPFGRGSSGGKMGYGVIYVKSPDDRKATLCPGGVGTTKVWVNGKEVVEVDFSRYPFCDTTRQNIELKKGTNEVLVKFRQRYAFFGFSADFLDAQGKEMTDLAYDTAGP